jgi:F0F1-type ATP synthase delta subunit
MGKNEERAKVIAQGLLSFLKKNKEEHLLGLVVEKLGSKLSKLSKVVVVSPAELNPTQRKKAVLLIKKLTKLESFDVEYLVDEKLIDGLVIKSEGRVWDLSLSGQLKEFSKGI